ncbi:hypothetical protein AB0D94_07840 [Streptomyces sp. NPDC048255]|uniref:hypothetical protein n=1 Tax=Streptomyces sp. NPDC048255 TaxID=3154713 RepID=UPI0033EC5F84
MNIRIGHRGVIELMVDGKETGRAQLNGKRPVIVSGELPTDPPRPVSVRIAPGPGVPRCTAVIDGEDIPMSPRAF